MERSIFVGTGSNIRVALGIWKAAIGLETNICIS